MKKASFLCISIVAVSMLNAQSQTLKNGILLPSKKGSKVLLPNAPKSIVPMQIPTSTIILVGGKMNPDKDGNILLPLPPNTDTKNDTYVTSPNYVDLSSSVGTITTDPKKGNYAKNIHTR